MKSILILAISFVLPMQMNAQTVANGNFNSGTTSWGCNPETNAESVYGGPSSNTVAEVDAAAGLCQTITGFTVGSYYQLSFLCSRRTTCGPTLQSMNVTVSGGAASKAISRNGTAYSLVLETINFVANSTSHTITFTGTTAETCNLLVDNIQISLVSGLPVELSAFTATCTDGKTVLNWTTESEKNSDYFTIEHSENGSSWNETAQVAAQLNSEVRTDYSYRIDEPATGINYYRLRLTDTDGTEEILSLVSSNCVNEEMTVYPNPVKEMLHVAASVNEFKGFFDAAGRNISETISVWNKNSFDLDLSAFAAGIYYLQLGDKMHQIVKE